MCIYISKLHGCIHLPTHTHTRVSYTCARPCDCTKLYVSTDLSGVLHTGHPEKVEIFCAFESDLTCFVTALLRGFLTIDSAEVVLGLVNDDDR